MIQFAAPAYVYWKFANFESRPTLTFTEVIKAFGFGLGFVAFMNARTKVDKLDINVQAIYTFVVQLAYGMIASRETSRTAQYRTALASELHKSGQLHAGVEHLINYIQSDISLAPDEQGRRIKKYETWLSKLSNPPAPSEIRALVALIEVRRKDLRVALTALGCSAGFLQIHFPKS